jgi:hypothetical protein
MATPSSAKYDREKVNIKLRDFALFKRAHYPNLQWVATEQNLPYDWKELRCFLGFAA